MVDINGSVYKGFDQPKTEETKKNEKNEKNIDFSIDPLEFSSESSALTEPDTANVNQSYKTFGKAVNTISFGEKAKDVVSFLSQKEDLSNDELKILELISKTNDENLQAILDAFDKMLEHSRKMMEQYKEYVKKVVIPKEEVLKIEDQKEEIKKRSARIKSDFCRLAYFFNSRYRSP